jgi:hypothetical protein
MGRLDKALWATTVEEAAGALEEDQDALGMSVFAACLVPALQGQWAAVELLVGTWNGGVTDVLAGYSHRVPDIVVDRGIFQLKTMSGKVQTIGVAALEARVVDVATSSLLAEYGMGRGTSLTLLHEVRSALPHGPGVFKIPVGYPDLPHGTDFARFRRLCEVALRRMQPPLDYISSQFGLNRQELGSLFGVSRQAVDEWDLRGRIPDRHAVTVSDLVSVAELLDRKLKPGRLQLLIRNPSPAFGGKTFLDMVREGNISELRQQTEQALDWAATA